jgi:hypothetical protein
MCDTQLVYMVGFTYKSSTQKIYSGPGTMVGVQTLVFDVKVLYFYSEYYYNVLH